MRSIVAEWASRAGVTIADLQRASGLRRYVTVLHIAQGQSTPRAATAVSLAAGSARLVHERGLAIEPLTAAEILGLTEAA